METHQSRQHDTDQETDNLSDPTPAGTLRFEYEGEKRREAKRREEFELVYADADPVALPCTKPLGAMQLHQ
jgi:hypothetical protein